MSYTYRHVVLVGIDGAGIFFKNAKTPFIRKMFAEGAGTEKGLTVFPTESAQCWGTMLIGVMPEVHGLTMQNITADKYTKRAEHPDIFSLIKKYRPEAKTGSFCHWNDINVGIVDGVEGVVTERGQDEPLTEKACEYIKAEKPDFLFVHLDSVDDAGHGCGYNTEKYLKQLDIADGYAERIYNAVREAGIADDTLFIVTTDHGGTGGSHGGWSDDEKYVFFVMTGKTVVKGARADMNVISIPAIIAHALGIPADPLWQSSVPDGFFSE